MRREAEREQTELPYFVHESAYVDNGADIGAGTKIWHFTHVRAGSRIGKRIDISGFNEDIANFQDHLRAAAKALHGVKPPANARDANKRLADSFDDLADDFEPVKEARRKSIVEAGKAADIVRKSAAIKAGRAAIRNLKASGYDVGAMGSL